MSQWLKKLDPYWLYYVADEAEDPAAVPIYWVSKWVDYSDKYGLGYQLCDNSVGVLFNDSTRVLLTSNGEYVLCWMVIAFHWLLRLELFKCGYVIDTHSWYSYQVQCLLLIWRDCSGCNGKASLCSLHQWQKGSCTHYIWMCYSTVVYMPTVT